MRQSCERGIYNHTATVQSQANTNSQLSNPAVENYIDKIAGFPSMLLAASWSARRICVFRWDHNICRWYNGSLRRFYKPHQIETVTMPRWMTPIQNFWKMIRYVLPLPGRTNNVGITCNMERDRGFERLMLSGTQARSYVQAVYIL